jgi:hypothetical protein
MIPTTHPDLGCGDLPMIMQLLSPYENTNPTPMKRSSIASFQFVFVRQNSRSKKTTVARIAPAKDIAMRVRLQYVDSL